MEKLIPMEWAKNCFDRDPAAGCWTSLQISIWSHNCLSTSSPLPLDIFYDLLFPWRLYAAPPFPWKCFWVPHWLSEKKGRLDFSEVVDRISIWYEVDVIFCLILWDCSRYGVSQMKFTDTNIKWNYSYMVAFEGTNCLVRCPGSAAHCITHR